MFPGDLEPDALFEDHGVSWLVIKDVFALERATNQRCFPAQPPFSARQRFNRQKCAHLLQDLVQPLLSRSAVYAFLLSSLDFVHIVVLKASNNIHMFDVLSLATTVLRGLRFHSTPARWPTCWRQSQDSSSVAAPQRTDVAHRMDNSANCY